MNYTIRPVDMGKSSPRQECYNVRNDGPDMNSVTLWMKRSKSLHARHRHPVLITASGISGCFSALLT